MASDQIVELLELMEEDPAWIQEFYSAVANSELVMPMVIHEGRGEPAPLKMCRFNKGTTVYDPFLNDFTGVDDWYNLVYSNRDIYNSVKPILDANFQRFGLIVDPLVQNGRQIINMCYKRKRCVAINLFAFGMLQYQLSFEQMEIIQRKPIIAKPKAEPEKEAAPVVSNDDALLKQNLYLKKIERMERGILQLQTHLGESLRKNAEQEAQLTGCAKKIAELESSLAAVQDFSLPVTVWEAVESTARRFTSRLIIHPRVKDIIEAWPYKKKSRCVAHTVKMLEAVAQTLYRMKFESADGYIDPLEFQRLTGYEIAMTEGKMTKRNQSLDALRYCRYEDRTVLIYAHIKKRIQNLHMRIYIGFLEEERKILIGHVGPHMPNSQTAGL